MLAARCVPLALAAVLVAADELAHAPEVGDELVVRRREVTRLEMDELEVRMGDRVVQDEVPDVRVVLRRTVAFGDEVLAVEDGEATALRRTFEELSGDAAIEVEAEGQREEHRAEAESELADAVVTLRRDEEGTWSARFEEGETGRQAHLDGLRADADLAALLPDDEVEEGDAWERDASVLAGLLAPGGDVWLLPDELDEGPWEVLDPVTMAASSIGTLGGTADELDGTVTVTYRGTAERDGRRLAALALVVDATATADRRERLAEALERVGLDPELATAYALAWTLELEGEVLWDVEEGRLHAVALDGPVELEAELGWVERLGEQEVPMTGRYAFSGSAEITSEDA